MKDRSQMDREDIFWRCERCFRVRRCCHRRYTPAHDENLNLAGSIGHEAERYASILPDGGQFSAGGKTCGRCSGREREWPMTRRTERSKNAYDDGVRAYMSTNTRPFVQMHFEREIRAKKEQSMEKKTRFGRTCENA